MVRDAARATGPRTLPCVHMLGHRIFQSHRYTIIAVMAPAIGRPCLEITGSCRDSSPGSCSFPTRRLPPHGACLGSSWPRREIGLPLPRGLPVTIRADCERGRAVAFAEEDREQRRIEDHDRYQDEVGPGARGKAEGQKNLRETESDDPGIEAHAQTPK